MVEPELISPGGGGGTDPMIAAHPDSKPIVTFRYGIRPPSNGEDKPPDD